MTDHEAKALARIEEETDPEALRQIAANARGKSPLVERAALRRLAQVCAKHAPGTVEHACWTMVHAVEELRRLNGRKPILRRTARRATKCCGLSGGRTGDDPVDGPWTGLWRIGAA